MYVDVQFGGGGYCGALSRAVSGSGRAEYINLQMQLAAAKFGINLELGLCLGGVCLKPYSFTNQSLP